MSVVGIFLLMLFVIVQGAVVFGTAYLSLRLLKVSRRSAKIAAMVTSYTLWVAITISGYTVLDGDGGLMDGFGLVLSLCFTALVSSFIYLVVWTTRGRA